MSNKQAVKKAIYVTTRLFWPPDSGRKVTLYHYCKGLNERLGYEVHVYSFLEGDQSPDMAKGKPDFVSSVTLSKPIGMPEKVKNVASALLDNSMPLQCCLFDSVANRNSLRGLAEALRPEVVIIDMVRLAPYSECVSGLGSAVVINFDDLLSKRYIRQQGETDGNVLGKYGVKVPGRLSRIVNGPMKNCVLKSEAKRVVLAESKYGKLADACLFVSPVEADELGARVGSEKCFAATMGAELIGEADAQEERSFDFGFVGNMHTAANQDSLRYLVNDVLPLLPGRTLRVIGVCPREVAEEYKYQACISFSGRVGSVADELTRCTLLLAPFVYGTGIKTKVIEAMGMGIPVVTNSIGLEGLSARNGKDVLCSDTAEGLAEAALLLLEKDQLRYEIAKSGREYVFKCHDWRKSIEDLGECLDFAVTECKRKGVH